MKKNGFTLVELLGTVVIIGIMSTIGVVSVNKMINSSKKKYCIAQRELIEAAAQSYYNDHKGKLPETINETSTVYLQNLVSENYIGKVYDYNKNEYNASGVFVKTQKVDKGKYTYTSNVDCEDNIEGATSMSPERFRVTFLSDDGEYYTNNSKKLDFKITAVKLDEKVYGYKYILYRRATINSSSAIDPYYISDPIYVNEPSNEISFTLSINKKTSNDGVYDVGIIPIDKNGLEGANVNYKDSKENNNYAVVVDTKKPKCTIDSTVYDDKEIKEKSSYPGHSGEEISNYYTSRIELEIKPTDDVAVGGFYITTDKLVQQDGKLKSSTSTYSYTPENASSISLKKLTLSSSATDNIYRYYGYVIDKAGNVNQCTRDIDKRVPTCSFIIYKNNNILINSTDTTALEEIMKIEKDNYTGTAQYWIKPLCSTGNDQKCKIYYQDRSAQQPGWVEPNPDFNGKVPLLGRVDLILKTEYMGQTYKCADTLSLSPDSNPPTCTVTIINNTINNWYNHDVIAVGTCSDSQSGCKENNIIKTISEDTSAGTSIGTVKDNYENSASCQLTNEIKIDTIPPTCTVVYDEDYVTRTCSDNEGGSDCTGQLEKQKVEESGTYGGGKVYDNAGNVGYCDTIYVEKETPGSVDFTLTCPNCDKWIKTKDNNKKVTVTISDTNGYSIYKKIGDGEYKAFTNTTDEFRKEDDNGRVCYQARNSNGNKKTKCVKVMIDNSKPKITKKLTSICDNKTDQYKCIATHGCSSNEIDSNGDPICEPTLVGTYHKRGYKMVYKDNLSGLKSGDFEYGSYQSSVKIGGYKYHVGHLFTSFKGTLKYKICDQVGNCLEGSDSWPW